MVNSNGVRELAYLVKVDDIQPIPGKDRVECAVIGGWSVMVRKDSLAAGDIAIYFEVDSKVDNTNPIFAFLESKHYKIKIQKYKNPDGSYFYSQGLLMPIVEFDSWDVCFNHVITPDGLPHYLDNDSRFLTEYLKVTYAEDEDNVRKSDSYQSMKSRHKSLFKKFPFKVLMRYEWGRKLLFSFFGKKKKTKGWPVGKFPGVAKSDEERCENMPFILNDKTPWVKTTKIDGTSCTYILERTRFNGREYYVCSRNVRQENRNQKTWHNDNVYWEIEDKYHIRDFLESLLKQHPDWKFAAIQGEGAGISSSGAGIQSNPHKFDTLRFFGFNLITPDKGRWNSVEARDLCAQYNIEWVPIVCENYILPDDFEEFKKSADGPCEAPGASGMREGYVYRNAADPFKSFKNVSREYLAKH